MTPGHPRPSHSQGEVFREEAAVAEKPGPQLDPYDPKDEENKEAKQQHIAQHGKSVQQKRHQDPHTCNTMKKQL